MVALEYIIQIIDIDIDIDIDIYIHMSSGKSLYTNKYIKRLICNMGFQEVKLLFIMLINSVSLVLGK